LTAKGFPNLVKCVPALEAEGFGSVDAFAMFTAEDAANIPGLRKGHVRQLLDVAARLQKKELS
jgi:hypothetical protein